VKEVGVVWTAWTESSSGPLRTIINHWVPKYEEFVDQFGDYQPLKQDPAIQS